MHFDYNLSNNSSNSLCFNRLTMFEKRLDDCCYNIEITNNNSNRNLTCLRVRFEQ